MAAGNKHLRYKEALNAIEAESPGSKHAFYHEFLARAADRFQDDAGAAIEAGTSELGACARCGSPSSNEICAFCLLVERTADAVPVTLGERKGARR